MKRKDCSKKDCPNYNEKHKMNCQGWHSTTPLNCSIKEARETIVFVKRKYQEAR